MPIGELHRLAKRLTLALGLALVAGLAYAVPASASVDAHCAITGAIPVQPPFAYPASSGDYLFNDLITACQGTIDGKTDVFTVAVGGGGSFSSHLCAFATFDDTTADAQVLSSNAGNEGRRFGIPYHISYAGAHGSMYFTSPAKGIGYLQMVPVSVGLPFDCTDQLDFTGEFLVQSP